MDKNFVGRLEAGAHQHRRKKQGVEIHNVLADEVIKLIFVAVPELIEIQFVFITVVFS